jgi:hypothetical protein
MLFPSRRDEHTFPAPGTGHSESLALASALSSVRVLRELSLYPLMI